MNYEIIRTPDGREILIPLPTTNSGQVPQPVYPPYQPIPQWPYPPPPGLYDAPAARPRGADRARKGRRTRSRGLAWRLVLFIVLSWTPTAVGCPGGTLLAWGLIVVWLTREATRRE